MAIAFGGISSVSTSQTPTSVSVSGSNTIGIVFVVGDTTADNISAVTWNSVSMTKIAAVQVPGDRYLSAWWVANPASATTISFTGGSFWRSFSFYYTGAKQTGQVDSSNTGTSTASAAITIATTVAAANCWYVMCQKDDSGGKTYTGSGVLASTRVDADAGGIAIGDSNGVVGTGSQSGTFTASGAGISHAGIAFSIAPVSAVDVTASPSVLSATFSKPAQTVSGGATVSPSALAALFAAQSVAVSGGANVYPSVLTGIFSLPTANIITPDAFASASVLAATFSQPGASAYTDVTVSPSALAAAFSAPSTTISLVQLITPNVLVATFSIPSVGIDLLLQFTASAPLSEIFSTQSPTIIAERNALINIDAPLSLTFSIPVLAFSGGIWRRVGRTSQSGWSKVPRT